MDWLKSFSELCESSFNESFEFVGKNEFLSSSFRSSGVFLIERVAKNSSIIEEKLVSLESVGLSLWDSSLDSDASSKVFNLVLKLFFVMEESVDGIVVSVLLVSEVSKGFVVFLFVGFEWWNNVTSKDVKEFNKSVNGGLISFGEGSKGGEDWLIDLSLLELDGVAQEGTRHLL